MQASMIFAAANILFTAGTFMLSIKVVKNRNIPNDLDLSGSVLTIVALSCMLAGYNELHMNTSVLFTIPTWTFWVFVVLCTVQNKFYTRKELVS